MRYSLELRAHRIRVLVDEALHRGEKIALGIAGTVGAGLVAHHLSKHGLHWAPGSAVGHPRRIPSSAAELRQEFGAPVSDGHHLPLPVRSPHHELPLPVRSPHHELPVPVRSPHLSAENAVEKVQTDHAEKMAKIHKTIDDVKASIPSRFHTHSYRPNG